MTNEELQNKFRELTLESNNIFDLYCKLESLISDYKTTRFFKITKKDIYEAYNIYNSSEGKIDKFAAILSNTSDGRFEEILQSIISALDFNNVADTLTDENKKLLTEIFPYLK